MRKAFMSIIITILFFTCSSKMNNKDDCVVEKIVITENNQVFVLSDTVKIQRIKELISGRKKELVKFKPRFWVEMIGPNCTTKFGVQTKFLKMDGVTYVLNEDLESIIWETLK